MGKGIRDHDSEADHPRVSGPKHAGIVHQLADRGFLRQPRLGSKRSRGKRAPTKPLDKSCFYVGRRPI